MAPRAKKAPVAAPVAVVDVVTEAELSKLVEDRKAVKELTATIAATKKRLECEEARIIARLRGGAKVEGRLVAVVEMVKGRVAVSWKDIAAKLAAKAGINFAEVEVEEKKAKEATLVPEPSLLIVGEAVEQYKA